MNVWRRLLLAVTVALGAGLVAFVLIVFVIARLGSCSPTVRTCDLPAIAAVGLGLVGAPLVAIVIGTIVFWRAGRGRAKFPAGVT